MRLKPALRAFEVLGCEASRGRVALHLREDTPLDPAKVMRLVQRRGSGWKLSPNMLLTRRFDPDAPGDSLDRIEDVLAELEELRRDDA